MYVFNLFLFLCMVIFFLFIESVDFESYGKEQHSQSVLPIIVLFLRKSTLSHSVHAEWKTQKKINNV